VSNVKALVLNKEVNLENALNAVAREWSWAIMAYARGVPNVMGLGALSDSRASKIN
jgi:hypothetical protein